MAFLSSILVFSLLYPIPAEEVKVETFLSIFKNPENQAEQIITELNLFPETDVNVAYETKVTEPRLVEKLIQFPNIHEQNNNIHYVAHHSGFFRLQHSVNARMFYYFFESRNKRTTDPVVVWLTGGPGCSGSVPLFYENGPFHIKDDLTLVWNNFGWDMVSNLILVDQPIGTGFSSTSSRRDIRTSTKLASVDFYDFLQAFFQKHPRYRNNDLYITGESYAGHFVPAFCAHITQANRKNISAKINLKGMAIGNGLTNPEIQYKAYADYALAMKLINQSHYYHLNKSYYVCQKLIKRCDKGTFSCTVAHRFCTGIFKSIIQAADGINYYDIRKRCEGPLCYDFSNVEKLLNQRGVKALLGVEDQEFVSCSPVVSQAMIGDRMKNFAAGIPAILADGVKLLVYAGEYDLICNWLGNLGWVTEMEWLGHMKFKSAPPKPFLVDGLKAGLTKSHGPLTFLKVYNAGHMVPMDQPKAALEMIKRWTQDQPL